MDLKPPEPDVPVMLNQAALDQAAASMQADWAAIGRNWAIIRQMGGHGIPTFVDREGADSDDSTRANPPISHLEVYSSEGSCDSSNGEPWNDFRVMEYAYKHEAKRSKMLEDELFALRAKFAASPGFQRPSGVPDGPLGTGGHLPPPKLLSETVVPPPPKHTPADTRSHHKVKAPPASAQKDQPNAPPAKLPSGPTHKAAPDLRGLGPPPPKPKRKDAPPVLQRKVPPPLPPAPPPEDHWPDHYAPVHDTDAARLAFEEVAELRSHGGPLLADARAHPPERTNGDFIVGMDPPRVNLVKAGTVQPKGSATVGQEQPEYPMPQRRADPRRVTMNDAVQVVTIPRTARLVNEPQPEQVDNDLARLVDEEESELRARNCHNQ